MPNFNKSKVAINKKSKTSESTSFNKLDSEHGGFNLNDEADDSNEE